MTTTKIASVGNASNSVRTVVPMWIAELLEICKGDKIEWKIKFNKKNEHYEVIMKKVKENE